MNRFFKVISAAFFTALVPVAVSAATSVIVVNPSHTNGWAFFDDNPGVGTGSGKLVNGPGTPPLGTGSAQLTVDSTGRWALGTQGLAGTKLADISRLAYSSYSKDNATLAPTLQFDIDYSATDSNTNYQGRLVYEPYMNGSVTPNTWQSWEATSGVWWASKTTAAGSNGACPQSAPCTWSQVKATFPTASIRAAGSTLFKVGGPWAAGFTGNVDKFIVSIGANTTTYDFEAVPTTKQDCKQGGYANFTNPSFHNQGQCVSYVEKHHNANHKDKKENKEEVTSSNKQSARSGNATSSGNTNGGSVRSGNASNSNNVTQSVSITNK